MKEVKSKVVDGGNFVPPYGWMPLTSVRLPISVVSSRIPLRFSETRETPEKLSRQIVCPPRPSVSFVPFKR
jgi:hypothetical protein